MAEQPNFGGTEVQLDNEGESTIIEHTGGIADSETEPVTPAPEVAPESTPENTPARLFAGKYKTQEQLEAGYLELQTAYGKALAGEPTPPVAPVDGEAPVAPTIPGITPDSLTRYSIEYSHLGTLSEKSFKELEGFGVSREAAQAVIQTSVAGAQASQEQSQAAVHAMAGGPEAYTSMVGWAASAFSPQEKEAYNEQVNSGNSALAEFAVNGLKARYEASTKGPTPTHIEGERPTDRGGLKPFGSMREAINAQKTPEYKTDPGFRAEVQKRMQMGGL